MANNMVGIREEGKAVLKSLARRKKVSMQGLVTALVFMADGKRDDLGIIDLDWAKIRDEFPNLVNKQKRSWDAVTQAVEVLMEEFDTAEEIAMHCRFTINQVRRAMEELK